MGPGDYGRSGVRARPRPEGLAAQVAAARGAGGGGKRATPSAWIWRPAGPTAAGGQGPPHGSRLPAVLSKSSPETVPLCALRPRAKVDQLGPCPSKQEEK
ncbi:unnamed protein product [Urochloa humidicola]